MVTLLVAGSLLSSGAAAVGYGKNKVQVRNLDWSVLNTPHFRIHYHDDATELVVRCALIAEQAYKEYSERLDCDLPWTVPFILYNSHNDFAQTNISDALIGEGTGGFSEALRNRIVLPYNGSHADFVHVIRHEIIHVFMFYSAYGQGGNRASNPFFHIPLWYAEGIAEWLSSGWDDQADLYIRDATINDYLWPLDRVGGFMVYKQGQAAMRLLSERYGPAKLVDFWWRVGSMRSVEGALRSVYGLSVKDLNKLYKREMRRRYWPRYNQLEQASDFARPLTDHQEEGSGLNDRPALNPAGDKLVFYSDREGLVDLWLMSALDGGIIRRLGQSRRSSRFESFHSFQSGISFSPDGREVALIAKSGNYETLHTIEVESGDVTRSLRLGFDVAVDPAWSPNGDAILVVGSVVGRTDLYLVDLNGGGAPLAWVDGEPRLLDDGAAVIRLTDDVGDESLPAWSPDGKSIVFVRNPLAEIEYQFSTDDEGNRTLDWVRPVQPTVGAEDWAAGQAVGPVADRGHLVRLDIESGERFVLGGADLNIREAIWLDTRRLALVQRTGGIDNLAIAVISTTGDRLEPPRRLTNVLGSVGRLSYSRLADRLVFSGFNAAGYDVYTIDRFLDQWAPQRSVGQPPEAVAVQLPVVTAARADPEPPPNERPAGLIEDYKPKLSLDLTEALAGGQVYFNPAVGLGMVNVITLSDLLADHRLGFLINFYGSFENSDLSASYTYLKRRIDYGGGIFHYSNYYNSVFTGVGELLSDRTKFKERNYGVFGRASYPFDTFRRLDLELQYMNSLRTNYEYTGEDYILLPGERTVKNLLQPMLSYTHDTALYGLHGPVMGSRWIVSAVRTVNTSSKSIDRFTGIVDYRRYWMPWFRNSFAVRTSLAYSDGDDPRGFVLGGPWTLRAYSYYDYQTIDNLAGTKMGLISAEYRVPLIDYFIFGWPKQWGFTGIGAAFYADFGTAWTNKVKLVGNDDSGRWGLAESHGDLGLGLRANVMFLPMKFDWAWKWDLRTVKEMKFQFSIGPEF